MQFFHYIYEHSFISGAVAWQITSAFIVTLPEKGKPYCFYDHMYDFSHQLLNMRQPPKQ